ncbi:MAG: hypothetical protein J6J42_01070 [Lachnospiraceae bacterium]|nr:hypothetical protein [Lachnospiraceae bacterium]MBP3608909.1 hypothetical protein [Lachnospiraceae bacterium]
MAKRIAAWVGIGVIVLMYVLSLIASLLARPEANQLFMASIVLTLVVPLLLWMFLKMYERAHQNDGISVSEMRKINKRIKAGENPEDIAREIEEKFKDRE